VAAFVEVAAFLPVRGTYCYSVPADLAAATVGARVLVPFGPRGVTGVIVRAGRAAPAGVTVRALRDLLDDTPAFDPELVELCMWVAEYYEAPPGEVLRAALPAGTAESYAQRPRLTPLGEATLRGEGPGLPARLARALAAAAAGKRARVAALVDAGLVTLEPERVRARVATRTVATVRLVREPDAAELARAPKRSAVVDALRDGPMDMPVLAARVPGAAAAVRALAAAGVVERGRRQTMREAWPTAVAVDPQGGCEPSPPPHPLAPTDAQAAALAAIAAADGFAPFLLHGVTGSGKTEVYLQAVARVVAAGKGAIVLVPEIALTPQLAARFRARFGDLVAVLHSGLSDGERFDQWRRLRSGDARIALGARSAVFAPVRPLGIIVVDEEHDSSFKQEDGVRYHARDVALMRARRAGVPCVLGSATPSLETFENARAGRFRLLELPGRATARPLPEVDIVDLRTYQPDPETMLSAPLAEALARALADGDQAILFLNRRGFATFVVCVGCGHAFRCRQCSVSLTYHRAGERLRCHYCGHAEPVPITCPKCRAHESIRRFGLGTERVEAALRDRFPAARVARLDRDTAEGKGLRDLLDRFARREIDVLVGTQMVTKGHDFPGVTLVGVLLADTALSLPDFRSSERTFQLLTQVAGRAGRGDRAGRVLIQTYAPEHPAVHCAKTHDFHGFFAAESAARAELGYPPHGRLIALRIDGTSQNDVEMTAADLARAAARLPGDVTVLGPAEAPLRRLMGRTRWRVWVKGADRGALRASARRLVDAVEPRGDVRVSVDVDPISAL
jgi:primosomal protein N' (replication factor Y)